MKYLTTLEAANDLKVSKQTLLNWLYAGKIPEPPRNAKGYRLWSESRVDLVRKIIAQGRLHSRTIVFRSSSNQPEFVDAYAREVSDFLRDGGIGMDAFLRALRRADARRGRSSAPRSRRATPSPSRRIASPRRRRG
jgi:hypothetical protein